MRPPADLLIRNKTEPPLPDVCQSAGALYAFRRPIAEEYALWRGERIFFAMYRGVYSSLIYFSYACDKIQQ